MCGTAQAVEAALASLPEEWRAIEVLVNNAGLSRGLTKLYEDDPENWDEMIDTNVKGLLYVTRAVVPGMVERGRRARHQPGLDRRATSPMRMARSTARPRRRRSPSARG